MNVYWIVSLSVVAIAIIVLIIMSMYVDDNVLAEQSHNHMCPEKLNSRAHDCSKEFRCYKKECEGIHTGLCYPCRYRRFGIDFPKYKVGDELK